MYDTTTKRKNERDIAELDRDRLKWRVRRRIAITSFLFSILTAIFYMIVPLFLTLEQASVAQQFNSIIITLIGFFSSIVIAYFGVATYSEVNTDKNGNKVEKELSQ